jgi:hypothetical protein
MSEKKMNRLDKQFSRKGFRYVQMWREGSLAIYRRYVFSNFRKIEHYEVIVIRVQPAWEAFGRIFEEREVYPSAESWGRLGFTCHSLDRAHDKVLELLSNKK